MPLQPSTRKTIQGCAIGCGGLLLLLILISASLYYWAVTPGTQIPTDFILGADSMAIMHFEGLGEDPGLRGMISKLIPEIQAAQIRRAGKAEIPWFVKAFFNRQGDLSERDVNKALRDIPKDLTITLESIPGQTEPAVAGAINLSRFPRLFRMAFSVATIFNESEEYRGLNLLEIDGGKGGALTFIEQTTVWTQNMTALRHIVAKRADALEADHSEVLEAYNNREERWDIYGVVENREQILPWLLSSLLEKADQDTRDEQTAEFEKILSEIRRLRFGIDVADEDSIEAQIDLEYSSEEEAEDQARMLQSLVDELSEGGLSKQVQFKRGVIRAGDTVRIDLSAQGIRKAIVDLAAQR